MIEDLVGQHQAVAEHGQIVACRVGEVVGGRWTVPHRGSALTMRTDPRLCGVMQATSTATRPASMLVWSDWRTPGTGAGRTARHRRGPRRTTTAPCRASAPRAGSPCAAVVVEVPLQLVADRPIGVDHRVVVQVGADPGQVEHRCHADGSQVIGVTDAGALQDGRACRTRRRPAPPCRRAATIGSPSRRATMRRRRRAVDSMRSTSV